MKKVIEGILEHKEDYSGSEYPYSLFIDKENISDLLYDIEGNKVRITIEEIEDETFADKFQSKCSNKLIMND